MRLKLGLDGKPLLPPRTGVYRYTSALLQALKATASPDLELVVLTPSGHRRTLSWVLWDLQLATWRGFSVFHFPFYYPPILPGCPVTVAIHDVLVLSHPQWFPNAFRNTLRWLIPQGARRADAVITGTQWVAGEITRLCGVSRERIHVIPYGVDHDRFFPPGQEEREACRKSFGLERPFVLMVGAQEPRRGTETLGAAVARLRERYPDLELVLVGQERAPMPVLAQLPSWVRRLGFVEDQWLPGLYANAEVVVAPSLGEGFDLPVLEALASGAVVVASDIPAHREVFSSAVKLFTPADTDSLTAALLAVLEDSELRRKLRQNGLELARNFTWEKAAQEHLAVWRGVGCGRQR